MSGLTDGLAGCESICGIGCVSVAWLGVLANVVAFLASGKARYATGATIDVVGASFLH